MRKQLDEDNPIAYIIIGLVVVISYVSNVHRAELEYKWYNNIGAIACIVLFQWLYRIIIRAINKRRKS